MKRIHVTSADGKGYYFNQVSPLVIERKNSSKLSQSIHSGNVLPGQFYTPLFDKHSSNRYVFGAENQGMIRFTPQNPTNIRAYKWFDSRAGNTYHTVYITFSDGTVAESGMCYGYGEQWLQTTAHLLGYTDLKALRNAVDSDIMSVVNVERQKDLF